MKALACELPAKLGLPLSRFSRSELRRQVLAAGIVADISGVTIRRWLHEDALRPWSRRSWIFPRDPDFATKAGRVLDLYHRRWNGRALTEGEFVISADEKTQIPIRSRLHPITPPLRAAPFASSTSTGVMASVRTSPPGTCTAPVSSATSSARSPSSIYFSILQRKALTPAHFTSQDEVADRILGFQEHYQQIASPFQWKFTRQDLTRLMARTPASATPSLDHAA